MRTPISEGQWVRHERFGVGIATHCTDTRTTIKFDEHGPKTFVASMFEAAVIAPPDRPTPARKSRKAAAKPAAG